jgi:hypothetical protein
VIRFTKLRNYLAVSPKGPTVRTNRCPGPARDHPSEYRGLSGQWPHGRVPVRSHALRQGVWRPAAPTAGPAARQPLCYPKDVAILAEWTAARGRTTWDGRPGRAITYGTLPRYRILRVASADSPQRVSVPYDYRLTGGLNYPLTSPQRQLFVYGFPRRSYHVAQIILRQL